jgi:large subunit ribosomal protein L10
MRHEKQLLLDDIKDQINQYNSFLIVRYLGFSANKANDLRRELAQLGGAYEVVRKRVLIKAAENAGITLDVNALPGHIGLVFGGKDPFEVTKSVFKFSQENEKVVEVIGGRFDGLLYNAEQVEILSKLPSKDEMRAQFLSVLEAPMSNTLAVMEALLTSVMHCLENKSQQESSENNPLKDV